MSKAKPTLQIDNERVRVIEWHFAPGAETGFHHHEYDYVIVPRASGKLKLIGSDGSEAIGELNEGVSYFRKAGVEHNVININDHDVSFIEIEMK